MKHTAEPIIIRKPSEKLSSLMEKIKIRKREQLENLSKQDCCTFNITLQWQSLFHSYQVQNDEYRISLTPLQLPEEILDIVGDDVEIVEITLYRMSGNHHTNVKMLIEYDVNGVPMFVHLFARDEHKYVVDAITSDLTENYSKPR